jgi:hypothetical protein
MKRKVEDIIITVEQLEQIKQIGINMWKRSKNQKVRQIY